ncbi:MAG: hypothetical protein WC554_15230 [Clostridia bacterium]
MSEETTEKQLEKFVKETEKIPVNSNTTLVDTSDVRKPWIKDEMSFGNQLGWQPIPVKDFPTQGLFYPEGTAFSIRAASVAEIRHWSTLNEGDISSIDDMLNYVIERCVTIKSTGPSSWKDIKEVDRFYLLLAVRELTFIKGENKLQVKVSETNKLDVTKEMIDYININEKLMKYYDSTQRCFVLKFKNGKELKIDIPSVGVTQFLKSYIQRKQQMQESIDEDYLNFAPFIIRDWRGLNDISYRQYIMESNAWDKNQISMMATIRQMFMDTINPVVKYTDEGGAERTAPLNFLGGIAAIFLVSNVFDELA